MQDSASIEEDGSRRAAPVVLLVGTRKGLFIARSDAARVRWAIEGPHLAGYEIKSEVSMPGG